MMLPAWVPLLQVMMGLKISSAYSALQKEQPEALLGQVVHQQQEGQVEGVHQVHRVHQQRQLHHCDRWSLSSSTAWYWTSGSQPAGLPSLDGGGAP